MDDSQRPARVKDFFAGIYLRVGGHARFWGWGSPRATLQTDALPGDRRTSGSRVYFACNRRVIGLVVR